MTKSSQTFLDDQENAEKSVPGGELLVFFHMRVKEEWDNMSNA